MSPVTQLLGPPAIHRRTSPAGDIAGNVCSHGDTTMDFLVSQTTKLDLAREPSIPTVDTIISKARDIDLSGKPLIGLTENFSPTFLATGNPCLDFFFHIAPDTPSDDLIRRLEFAWSFDSLTTLKLICNLRGVRGTGKSDKEGFYTSALWLHKHHPKTLARNVRAFADFGYFKDLLEILYRILEGSDVRRIAKEEWQNRKSGKKFSRKMKNRGKFKRESRGKSEKVVENVEEVEVYIDKEKARVLRMDREIGRARKAVEKYSVDSEYRNLHDRIADLFAELLKSDVQYFNSGQISKISLASKWCPTIDSSFDKATLICESIAKRVFPRDSDPKYAELEEAHYVFRVRDRLRKEVLVPLHKALQLPEIYMSSNQWESLPYNRVASIAMKTYKGLFYKHDAERFAGYLEDVKSGKAKIAAGALLPHEIIGSLNNEDGGTVAELQWARMVDDLAKKGKLTNCIAVCDVSGSMEGTPMVVSVALGLLVSELSEEPWKGNVITFSENPELHKIEGDSLLSKTEFIREMDWGANTDFQKVFDRILQVAVDGNLSEDKMIKRIFVFSDMEFDCAAGSFSQCNSMYDSGSDSDMDGEEASENDFEAKKKKILEEAWKTDYEVIQKKFQEIGYNMVPEIVFWNLRNSSATPVVAKQPGVALVSGFSKNLLTLFLEEGGIINPEHVMQLAICGEEYKKLFVVD
ncbi:hypothetical protein L1049_017600 [Liquidambar formosana]|uniref:Uncharacterized protein n=1 Tax=Liquidambar formosana TaxID=63359 RepID=A0AAP0S7P7_LIQFO